eukprot:1117-Heterococcus_DN1.PRE.1
MKTNKIYCSSEATRSNTFALVLVCVAHCLSVHAQEVNTFHNYLLAQHIAMHAKDASAKANEAANVSKERQQCNKAVLAALG